MSDRELLTLAAKAAGYGEVWYLEGYDTPYIGPRYEVGKAIQYTTFRPLTDDGDALRLAVKLELPIDFWDGMVIVADDDEAGEPYGNDPFAATRRAIVRAAAEIGRAMT